MPPLSGLNALVTGGSRGIGRAIVERLAHDGADVAFSYRHDSAAASELSARLTANGRRTFSAAADLSDPGSIVGLFGDAESFLGRIDVVVHNAAVENGNMLISDATDADYEFIVNGNIRGGFTVVREASRRLRDGGRLINISSLDTAYPAPRNALYAGSKAAVEQFVSIASKELGPRGITANTVSPGATDTSRLRSARNTSELAGAAAAAALGRLGTPEDVAAVVAFLAGPDGGWVTGQNIRATGGIH